MDNNRDRMGKDRNQQHRSPAFKFLRRRRSQLSASSSSRLADHQNKNRDSFIQLTKTTNKRSKSIYKRKKKLIICSFAYWNDLLLVYLFSLWTFVLYVYLYD